jgi:hypothetical protein
MDEAFKICNRIEAIWKYDTLLSNVVKGEIDLKYHKDKDSIKFILHTIEFTMGAESLVVTSTRIIYTNPEEFEGNKMRTIMEYESFDDFLEKTK